MQSRPSLALPFRLLFGFAIERCSPLEHFTAAKLFIKPGDTVIDVGANIGQYSGFYAQLTGDRGVVISFEPNPLARKMLQVSVRRRHLPWIEVRPEAVSDTSGQSLTLQINPFSFGHNSTVVSSLKNFERMGWPVYEARVQTLALDDMLTEGLRLQTLTRTVDPPSFVKVDAEGSDEQVLRGAAKLISHCRPIIEVELGYTSGSKRSEVPDWLRSNGYQLFDLANYQLFDRAEELSRTQDFLTDLLAVPEEKLEPYRAALEGLQIVFPSTRSR